MKDKIAEGQTRIDQHAALQWASLVVSEVTRDSPREEEPGLDEVNKRIQAILTELSHGVNVDFESIIKGLMSVI